MTTIIRYCEPDNNDVNNTVKRTVGELYWIPFITTFKYFFWNYENIYFLIISIYQLLTLWILPKEWSPTGPYSTFIPLCICIVAEIIKNMYVWIRNWRVDSAENNRTYVCLLNIDGQVTNKKSCQLLPGDVIKLCKDDVCPVDGILIDNNEKYSKISLSMLTGESNLIYVSKPKKNIWQTRLFWLHPYNNKLSSNKL